MKKRRLFIAVCITLIFATIVTGCAGRKNAETSDYGWSSEEGSYNISTPAEARDDFMEEEDWDTTFTNESAASTTFNPGEASKVLQPQDKIVRTFKLDVETQEFDDLIKKLDSEIGSLGGYVEESEIRGRSFYNSEGNRDASITARIPMDKVDEFVKAVGESANVVNRQESTENVTLQYMDIEGRKKVLEIEQDRLFDLLGKAESMETIITLESRLSEIRYELQYYGTTLRIYDNKVEYGTVDLSIREVGKLTPPVEIQLTLGTRIISGLSYTLYNIIEGFEDFLVWFVVNLPYLLIWAVVITVFLLVIKRICKKYGARRRKNNNPIYPTGPSSPANPAASADFGSSAEAGSDSAVPPAQE